MKKKVIERIVESPGAPNENDLWLNGKTLKKFQNGEWVAISGGGGGSASSLSDMTDVDISSPADGDTLVYNATTHKWESGSGGGCSCLPPMLVEGTMDTIDGNYVFSPNVGMPSFAEARAYMLDGGQVYMIADTGEETIVNVAGSTGVEYISGYDFNWLNSGSEGGDEPQTYTIHGSVNSDKQFFEGTDEMTWSDAYNHFNNGDTIILQFTSLATGMTLTETVVSMENEVATTTNGFHWLRGIE